MITRQLHSQCKEQMELGIGNYYAFADALTKAATTSELESKRIEYNT